jgi:hypothetical protein
LSKNTKEFKKQCITKKEIRNRPVKPITNFLPIDEEKAFAILPIGVIFNLVSAKVFKICFKIGMVSIKSL